jgi:hypothetical protein
MAVIGELHDDTKELLIGLCAVVLFGVALIVWPSLAEFVGRFVFFYPLQLLDLLLVGRSRLAASAKNRSCSGLPKPLTQFSMGWAVGVTP